MGPTLTIAEAAAALLRGVGIEQFVSLSNGHVAYLSAWPTADGFSVARHVVLDEGTEAFLDLSEFTPVDAEPYVGEGVVVMETVEATDAVLSAAAHGGSAGAWVNFSMASVNYRAAKSETRSSAVDAALYWRERDGFLYALHELPSGVLYGANGATVGECRELARDLEDFASLCARLELADHALFIDGCRWHFEHYPHYLGRHRHFPSYESYLVDRGGPRRIEGPPDPPAWLLGARPTGRR